MGYFKCSAVLWLLLDPSCEDKSAYKSCLGASGCDNHLTPIIGHLQKNISCIQILDMALITFFVEWSYLGHFPIWRCYIDYDDKLITNKSSVAITELMSFDKLVFKSSTPIALFLMHSFSLQKICKRWIVFANNVSIVIFGYVKGCIFCNWDWWRGIQLCTFTRKHLLNVPKFPKFSKSFFHCQLARLHHVVL